jgi:hypothetical protein
MDMAKGFGHARLITLFDTAGLIDRLPDPRRGRMFRQAAAMRVSRALSFGLRSAEASHAPLLPAAVRPGIARAWFPAGVARRAQREMWHGMANLPGGRG